MGTKGTDTSTTTGGTGRTGDTAASLLAALDTYYREHPNAGPSERHTPQPSPSAPLQLATVDHIDATVAEITAHTRRVNPDAGPLPPHVADIYAWCRENTADAGEREQERTAALEYRHYLEHAIRTGDTAVIRSHRCPACRTLGLLWQPPTQRAVCINRYCARDSGGTSRTWTLARLAFEHTAAQHRIRRAYAT